MSKIEPCPFCGSVGVIRVIHTRSQKNYFILCTNLEDCGMSGPICNDKLDAINTWNTLPRKQDMELYVKKSKLLINCIAEYIIPRNQAANEQAFNSLKYTISALADFYVKNEVKLECSLFDIINKLKLGDYSCLKKKI